MIKKIIDWWNREPSKWEVIVQREIVRCRDKNVVGFLIISRDQYGNIREKRVIL